MPAVRQLVIRSAPPLVPVTCTDAHARNDSARLLRCMRACEERGIGVHTALPTTDRCHPPRRFGSAPSGPVLSPPLRLLPHPSRTRGCFTHSNRLDVAAVSAVSACCAPPTRTAGDRFVCLPPVALPLRPRRRRSRHSLSPPSAMTNGTSESCEATHAQRMAPTTRRSSRSAVAAFAPTATAGGLIAAAFLLLLALLVAPHQPHSGSSPAVLQVEAASAKCYYTNAPRVDPVCAGCFVSGHGRTAQGKRSAASAWTSASARFICSCCSILFRPSLALLTLAFVHCSFVRAVTIRRRARSARSGARIRASARWPPADARACTTPAAVRPVRESAPP